MTLRKPKYAISMYGGHHNLNPLTGQHPSLYAPGGLQRIIDRMHSAYQLGHRDFLLWLPAGSLKQDLMASAQWEPLPDYRKLEFTEQIPAFLAAHPGSSIGIYGGFRLEAPHKLDMTAPRLPFNRDTMLSRDIDWYHRNVKPWVDLGITEYHFDAASHAPVNYERVRNYLLATYPKLKVVGGEAVPTSKTLGIIGSWKPVTKYIGPTHTWMALERFFNDRNPAEDWTFHDSNVSVILSSRFPITESIVRNFVSRSISIINMSVQPDIDKMLFDVTAAAADEPIFR
jgi:hypothetical protein